MRIGTKTINEPNVVIIPIPRTSGDIILRAKAVLDLEEFQTLCPTPKAREITLASGEKRPDIQDKDYLKAITELAQKRTAYTVLKSLEATEDLHWDTVNLADPDSWKNWETELKSSGFSEAEKSRILMGVMEANGLVEAKIEEARKRFLVSQAVVEKT